MAKKKKKLKIQNGQAHIKSTFNNTIVTLTDKNGNAIEKNQVLTLLSSLKLFSLTSSAQE